MTLRPTVFLLLLAALLGNACSRQSATEGSKSPTPEAPVRIVSLAPNLTEMLFAMEAGDLLVGRTMFCDFPAQATSVPVVSGGVSVDIEALLQANPTTIVALEGVAGQIPGNILEQAGIQLYATRVETWDDIVRTLDELSRITSRQAKAQALIRQLQEGLEQRNKLSARPIRAAILYGHRPLVAAGGTSWGNELLRLAGVTNVFADSDRPNLQIDAETLLSRHPDLVIDIIAVGAAEGAQEFWKEFHRQVPDPGFAVALSAHEALLRPGPRVLEAVDEIHRLIQENSRDRGEAP